MKHIKYLLVAILLCDFAYAGPRGERIEAPVKGIILAGVKTGAIISKGVVFLADNGALYVADSAVVSADSKSITFKGKPMIVRGGSRMYSDDDDQWVRITVGGKIKTSKGKWQTVAPTKYIEQDTPGKP